jgi:signal transduction histidine kinase
VTLRVAVPPGLPPVLGDPPKLMQVLVNLVVNAIDAMREAGTAGEIELAGEQVGDRVVVRVADRGPGVDARIAGEMFRPFVSTKERGTGLGLSIAKKIVDQHGGEVELGPRPGGGTVARFALQIVREREHDA